MFILLTKFIHPIKRKRVFSKYFNFYFDNPRTKEELDIVRNIVKKEFLQGGEYKLPMEKEVYRKDILTYEKAIENFCNLYFNPAETIKITDKIRGNKKEIINFYAKNWVIIRFDNLTMNTEIEKLRKAKKKNSCLVLEDNHMFFSKEALLVSYSYLISFLIGCDKDYFGWSVLLTKSVYDEVLMQKTEESAALSIFCQMISISYRKKDSVDFQYNFTKFLKLSRQFVNIIDRELKNQNVDQEALIYVGKLLSSANPCKDKFSSLVRIVGIIEMLITHNPDFNRFNVEDSITRQFVFKTLMLAYMDNKNIDLENIQNSLKEIYTQRSNIVHGNFKEITKFINKLKKEGRYFDALIKNAYNFSGICLKKYIQDPKFIDCIKKL